MVRIKKTFIAGSVVLAALLTVGGVALAGTGSKGSANNSGASLTKAQPKVGAASEVVSANRVTPANAAPAQAPKTGTQSKSQPAGNEGGGEGSGENEGSGEGDGNDGPGGHEDPPGQDVNHEFQGEE